MKHTILFSFLLVIFFACQTDKGQLMPTASTIKINKSDSKDTIILKAAHVVPTANQLEALKNEFIAFIHFGPNTFTQKEWGNGKENPEVFNLKELDTDQWCSVMKAAGMKKVILTVKHHDGFCLWQTRYTRHGIMSTAFQNGKGDILRSLSESCQKYDLKLGVYLSPADLYQIENHSGLYGNLSKKTERVIPRKVEGRPFKNKTTFKFKVDDYNEYFLNQLFELLTEYGPVYEVWFDGAHPKRKGGQTYNYMAWKELIHTLAPEAVIFGRQDIRWCGNESGRTRDTEWNIIPYENNPNNMERFADLTGESIGSREDLLKGNYLHYQFAETNTSVREGWFYRDDSKQKVRSVDDVFDIYERSVGGNSVFLLNIPPNRDGRFSDTDVHVLTETGKRIRETYHKNLLAEANCDPNLLDNDMVTYQLLDGTQQVVEVVCPQEIEVNRFVIQEAIGSHGERIEKHALDAWLNGKWQELTVATNVGYKRILRFPAVKASKWRLRVIESRYTPAIAGLSAHFYKSRPSQVAFSRNLNGFVTIQAKKHDFAWKPHGENASSNTNSDMLIRYTTDGTEPTKESTLYTQPFLFEAGLIKARAFVKDDEGSVADKTFGIIKQNWKLIDVVDEVNGNEGTNAFDEDVNTFWLSKGSETHFLSIDLGTDESLTGFIYTPQTVHSEGMIEEGVIKVSEDGKRWKVHESFVFGNLINDPTPRTHYFNTLATTRFIRIESKVIAGGKESAAIAEISFIK